MSIKPRLIKVKPAQSTRRISISVALFPDVLNVMILEATIDSQKLTPREREVLTWAAAGKSAWETATILAISEKTVIHHLVHIRRKLGAVNTTQAVVVALRDGELRIF